VAEEKMHNDSYVEARVAYDLESKTENALVLLGTRME
jgi:hypothetical protein